MLDLTVKPYQFKVGDSTWTINADEFMQQHDGIDWRSDDGPDTQTWNNDRGLELASWIEEHATGTLETKLSLGVSSTVRIRNVAAIVNDIEKQISEPLKNLDGPSLSQPHTSSDGPKQTSKPQFSTSPQTS